MNLIVIYLSLANAWTVGLTVVASLVVSIVPIAHLISKSSGWRSGLLADSTIYLVKPPAVAPPRPRTLL
ncbi:hypothetical protein [Leptothermofonsia sp. ETS-13]|uniref:hypothetical protein n=1 Tax=Leptothermofonsia sp. ETS-13 TaxID=3035696 RepID=UPI003BA103F8